MQLHSNFWYAEYHHDQAIRQFVNLFDQILDVFEKHDRAAACWDFDTQLTLDIFQDVDSRFIDRLNDLLIARKHDVIPSTWATTLATHHTSEEFQWNLKESTSRIKSVFKRVAPTWVSQDGAFSPQFIPYMKELGLEYVLLDARLLNRVYANNYSLEQRFRPGWVKGVGINHQLPIMWFGIEGLNSYGDYAAAFNKCVKNLAANSTTANQDHLIYPFIDTERILPERLDKWLTQIEEMGAEYCTPSRFIVQNPPKPIDTPFEIDVVDWHDWSFHNDILADQRLWTMIEQARAKIREGRWWLSQLQQINGNRSNLVPKLNSKLDEAFRESILAQSSDKTHWYACKHKIDIGQRYATAAYEKAAYVCGICSQQLTGKDRRFPLRAQAMKDDDINLTLLNCNRDLRSYPQGFPVGLEFPYIITVNINTSPLYEIESMNNRGVRIPTPTHFHILPGLTIHNYRTELFYQIPKTLEPNETLPITLLHSRNDLDLIIENKDTIENERIRVKINSNGDIQEILDKKHNTIYSIPGELSETPLMKLRFEHHLAGAAVKNIRVTGTDSDDSLSLSIFRESTEADGHHRLHLTTTYRLFPQFPGILVDSLASFAGPLPGFFCPFEFTLPSVSSFTRDVLNESLTTPYLLPKPQQIFLNDWCIIENSHQKLGIAFESRIHSCKQLLYHPKIVKENIDRVSFGFHRHFPEWVAQHLLQGTLFQRMWIVPLSPDSDMKEDQILLRNLSDPPTVAWYL
jgi:hypothetical protein